MFSTPQAIFFIIKGTVEVSFYLDDGYKFVVEKLQKGSVINVRGIFMQD